MAFTLSTINFKSSKFIFSKIKRELKSLNAVNKLDEADFALYTAEVLKMLGIGSYREEEAILTVVNKKAQLPKGFMQLYSAQSCTKCHDEFIAPVLINTTIVTNDITCEILKQSPTCNINCEGTTTEKVTVKEYVSQDCTRLRKWNVAHYLRLSPNVKDVCATNCPNINISCNDEITISNKTLYTNFDNADIYIQYYALPLDEDNTPLIPDVIEIEKMIEWYIKKEILLNGWFDNSIPDIQQRWAKAEQEFEKYSGEANYLIKLPSFNTLLNSVRRNRTINKVNFFSQIDAK